MSPRVEKIPLPVMSPGTNRHLTVWRFGCPGARPKAYLQAGLHADENPGMLVLHHLQRQLSELDARGEVTGEVILLPVANPIGLSQHLHDRLAGRFEMSRGANFNRGFPSIADQVASRVDDHIGDDVAQNQSLVRRAALEVVSGLPAEDDLSALRQALMGLAVDADICLDLHCDFEAVMHLYTGNPLWPAARDLAALLGAHAVLLETESGGEPFDEAIGGIWWSLAARFPDHPFGEGCLSATIELRGEGDVSDELAKMDADGLLRFLQSRDVVAGDPGPLPALINDATPLDGVEWIKALGAGIVSYRCGLGERVEAGTVLGEVIDPLETDNSIARQVLRARYPGVVFARRRDRVARPGQVLIKVAGATPIAGREGSHLLSD